MRSDQHDTHDHGLIWHIHRHQQVLDVNSIIIGVLNVEGMLTHMENKSRLDIKDGLVVRAYGFMRAP